eukprot:5185250-Lingulodinium_polyedra.AAC.1
MAFTPCSSAWGGRAGTWTSSTSTPASARPSTTCRRRPRGACTPSGSSRAPLILSSWAPRAPLSPRCDGGLRGLGPCARPTI